MPNRSGGYTAPCNSRPECRHAKHGYTRKDRPAPTGGRVRRRKTEDEIRALALHHTCWCNTSTKQTEATA